MANPTGKNQYSGGGKSAPGRKSISPKMQKRTVAKVKKLSPAQRAAFYDRTGR